MTGPFLWGSRAKCQVIEWNDQTGVVEARHDGYQKSHSVYHHRRITCDKDGFVIKDFFDPCLSNTHNIISRFLLHENIQVNITSPTTCLLCHPSFSISLTIKGDAFFACNKATYAPKYYQMLETNLLSIQGNLPYSIHIKI